MTWQDYVLNGGTEADKAAAEKDHADMVGEPTDALVSELREDSDKEENLHIGGLLERAADEITHLQSEVERLTRELGEARDDFRPCAKLRMTPKPSATKPAGNWRTCAGCRRNC